MIFVDIYRPSCFPSAVMKNNTWENPLLKQHFNYGVCTAEGWGIFDNEGRLEIQKLDDTPEGEDCTEWESDEQAICYVQRLADAGSVYHRIALEIVGTR